MRTLPLLLALACASAAPAVDAPPSRPPPAPVWRTEAATVETAFPLPAGAERVPTDGFGDHLRTLPLRPPGTPVRTHDGRVVPTGLVRVVDLPMSRGDLQQCADTAIRLRATWLRDQGRPVTFHATSGDPLPWSRVQGGELPHADGNAITWRPGRTDWEGYLRRVFMWAGTASLEAHDTVTTDTPRAGDLLVQGGFPGHAVILLDVARRGEETLVLLAQGFMPAQDAHVLVGPEAGWWVWQDPMALPSWTFSTGHLRRWSP